MRILLSLFLLAFAMIANAAPQQLNIYIWAGYIPNNVITEFEKSSHVHVNLSQYASNEELFASVL